MLQLLLLIGAKLEHIINKLAHEVATKHAAGRGEVSAAVVRPSDKLFWFHSPRLVLVLIHFILFQNAFEFAYFVWTLVSTTGQIVQILIASQCKESDAR
jgi:mlo protein